MKLKSFDDYLKTRLDPQEIAQIKKQAKIEFEALKLLQHDVAVAVTKYMEDEGVGFNEMVRRLGISPTQARKIAKGEANLTFSSLAHLAGLLGKKPHLVFS